MLQQGSQLSISQETAVLEKGRVDSGAWRFPLDLQNKKLGSWNSYKH